MKINKIEKDSKGLVTMLNKKKKTVEAHPTKATQLKMYHDQFVTTFL